MTPTERKRKSRANQKAKQDDLERRNLIAAILKKIRRMKHANISRMRKSLKQIHEELISVSLEKVRQVYETYEGISDQKGQLEGEVSGGKDGRTASQQIARNKARSGGPFVVALMGPESLQPPAKPTPVAVTIEESGKEKSRPVPSSVRGLRDQDHQSFDDAIKALATVLEGNCVCGEQFSTPRDMELHIEDKYHRAKNLLKQYRRLNLSPSEFNDPTLQKFAEEKVAAIQKASIHEPHFRAVNDWIKVLAPRRTGKECLTEKHIEIWLDGLHRREPKQISCPRCRKVIYSNAIFVTDESSNPNRP